MLCMYMSPEGTNSNNFPLSLLSTHQCPFHGPIVPRDEQGQPVTEAPPTGSTATLAAGGSSVSPASGQSSDRVGSEVTGLTWEDVEADVLAAKGRCIYCLTLYHLYIMAQRSRNHVLKCVCVRVCVCVMCMLQTNDVWCNLLFVLLQFSVLYVVHVQCTCITYGKMVSVHVYLFHTVPLAGIQPIAGKKQKGKGVSLLMSAW